MNAPIEFSSEHIATHSPLEEQLYTAFLKSGEPYRSLYRKNFHQGARHGYVHRLKETPTNNATPGLDLEDNNLYYNTQVSSATYWKDVDLPTPTKDIRRLRHDLREWGYCLISEGLSASQYGIMKQRLDHQAEGERKAGVASWMGTAPAPGHALPNTQFLHTLINKGKQFIQCVEQESAGVQAGPLIEQLLRETMGEDFLMSSFIAIISNPFNLPQGLHQDQAIAPFQDPVAPFTVNTMYIMDDMGENNGGTLVIPGSHYLTSEARSGQAITKPLPPAINLAAPAGTIMLFEGRLLHGTGVNKSNASRTIMVMNSVKSFMRQQELHLLSADPDVLARGSAKFLYRIGAQPTGLGGIEGAWNGDFLVNQRLMIERGEYLRIGELSPKSEQQSLAADFGYRYSEIGIKQFTHQPEMIDIVRQKYADLEPSWNRPNKL